MHAVTAGAIRHDGGTDLRRHSVIAGKIGRLAVTGDAKFLGELPAGVAAPQVFFSQHLSRKPGHRNLRRLDRVNAVTIGTDRGLPITARDWLLVDAFHELRLTLGVTLGAGSRAVELEDRGT